MYEINSEIFFHARPLFLGGGLSLFWINSFFCWQYVLFGGLSFIQVNTVLRNCMQSNKGAMLEEWVLLLTTLYINLMKSCNITKLHIFTVIVLLSFLCGNFKMSENNSLWYVRQRQMKLC